MSDSECSVHYISYALHKDCGGHIRAIVEVTGDQRQVGFVCTKCRAMWSAPDGMMLAVPDTWTVAKLQERT